ncbi:helix-turn-helix domain-containing protein [Clostridium neonatale]|uniref:helix-turn-helix domain-containing protein n=1 Tax=Clostridium neonatale TaxID=137838 RepID=UPI00291B7D8F|nr:helix-turn-helix domain-containing protein [Clostridium neonatale]CAI3557077.1 conserved hypothetical protein [Clostridium neonatale]CAI3566077.1 conserved hypothetical protein [Clostridium neonatale]
MNDELFCSGIYKEGYGVIPKLVMRNSKLSLSAKAVYAYICSFAGSGGNAFPSLELICSELNISEKKMYKCRKELIDNNLITVEKKRIGSKYSNNIYTLITNPASQPSQNGHVQNQPSQNEHVQNEPCPKVGTISNSIINKKEKEKKKSKTEFDELINNYTENENLKTAIYEFIKHRKSIKSALTTLALKKIITKLDVLAKDDNTKIAILENSIMNGWKSVFPMSDDKNVIQMPRRNETNNPFKIDESKLGRL